METIINDFVQVLRRHQLRVSPAEGIDADANSDFGVAAEQFKSRYLPIINHLTTLVVLGDRRNKGKWANAAALEEIAQHARQVIWITPEPRSG